MGPHRTGSAPAHQDKHCTDSMPSRADVEFLRTAVACGALAPGPAREILAALEEVERLGARSSAREIAVNRGLLDREQAETIAASTPSATPARPGNRLGNFMLLSRIGSGGMGVVFRAIQLTTGRHVALKLLPRRLARDKAYVGRFLREAQAAARLDHPNIVRAIDAGEAAGQFYFAMELVAGETLKDRLRRLGRLPEREVAAIGRQVALALEHANARGIVHRDVKPANILLTPEGVAKLADLGLARHSADGSVTLDGLPIGTPLYMSPEQARGRDADIRSDIYSLGATLYHAATGSLPFVGQNATAVITKHLFEKPVPPHQRAPQLSEGLSLVIMKMLAKRPADRYQNPTRLLADLERVAAGRPPVGARSRTTSRALRRTRRRKRSPIAALVASAMVFACLAGLWCLFSAFGEESEAGRQAVAAPRPVQPRPVPTRPRPRRTTADAASAELKRVLEWARGATRHPNDVIRRLRVVAARYPGTDAAASAQRQVARLRQELAASERAALEEAVEKARRLCREDRYAEAAALLDDFAAHHHNLSHQAAEARGQVIAEAVASERRLRAEARRLADGGDLDGAIAAYRRIEAFGLPQLAARARREIALLEKQKAAAHEAALSKARDHYLDLRLRIRPLLAARRYEEARRLLEEALTQPDLRPVADDIQADIADIQAVEAFWTAVRRGAQSLEPGTPFSVGGIRGTFVRMADGAIEINASGVRCRKPLSALKAGELVALARRGTPDKKQAALARGLFFLAEGKVEEAERAFEDARAAGADVARYRALVARSRSDALEASALEHLAKARQAARGEKWDEVASSLAALRSACSSTHTFQANRRGVERLDVEARCARLSVTDLFHCPARSLPDGRLALSYDFSDPAQLSDWELAGRTHALAEGALVLAGARATLRAALEPPIDLTVEMADASGPPGEWSVGFGPGAGMSFICSVLLPERAGLPLSLVVRGRAVATARAAFPKGRSRVLTLSLRPEGAKVDLDAQPLLNWQPQVPLPAPLRAAVVASGQRKVSVGSIGITATVSAKWADAELARLKAAMRRQALLASAPWQPLFDGTALTHWQDPAGVWTVGDRVAKTQAAGTLVLRKMRPRDFELRLKIRPASAATLLRVVFRATERNQCYVAAIGGQPPQCRLFFLGSRADDQEELARAERLDWRGGRWYDVRVSALGPDLAVEIDGATAATARDTRLGAGAVSLEVVGGAALGAMALRLAE